MPPEQCSRSTEPERDGKRRDVGLGTAAAIGAAHAYDPAAPLAALTTRSTQF
jgi:hypothetical protein